jgi:hypothetical protein
MKYIHTLFIAMVLSVAVNAQSNCKFGVGLHFSPDFTFNNFENSDSLHNSWVKLKNQREKAILGYTSGISIQGKLAGILSFESGLNYSKKATETQFDSTINGVPSTLDEQSIYNYLQVPLKLKFHFASGKTTIYLTAGTSAMFLLDAAKNTSIAGGVPTKTDLKASAIKQFSSSVLLSIGFDFQLAKRVFFRVEPNVARTLDSIKKEGVSNILASAGLNMGLFFVGRK